MIDDRLLVLWGLKEVVGVSGSNLGDLFDSSVVRGGEVFGDILDIGGLVWQTTVGLWRKEGGVSLEQGAV